MKKPKHSPAPWRLKHSASKNAWNVIGTIIGGKHKIARIPYEFISEAEIAPHNEKMRNEAKADAELIAAAPEILAALRLLLSYMDAATEGDYEPRRYDFKFARDLINKHHTKG